MGFVSGRLLTMSTQDDVERQRRMVLALPEFENAAYLAFSGCLMNLLEEVCKRHLALDVLTNL